MEKFWKFSWFIAIILIIITALGSTLVHFDNVFGRELSNFWDIVVFSNYEIIGILILVFVISLIIFFVDKYFLKRKWKFKRITVLVLIIFTLFYSIKPIRYSILTRKKINHCTSIEPNNRIIYEIGKANIYFTKEALLDKIENRLVYYYNDTLYNDTSLYYNYKPELNLKEYLKNNVSLNDLTLKDTFYFLPDTFRLHSVLKESWTYDTVPVIDETDIRNDISEAMYYLIIKILKESKIMVYNKASNKFEDYIYYKEWHDALGSSGIDFYFPNDSLFVERVLTLGL